MKKRTSPTGKVVLALPRTRRNMASESSSKADQFGSFNRLCPVLASIVLVCAFLLGGGARPDIASLPYLRAICAIGLGLAAVGMPASKLHAYRALLWLAAVCAGLPILHLIPLPPGFANAFSGHSVVADIDRYLGLNGSWRPLTLSPQWTLNAILALTVPLSALFLAIRLSATEHRRLAIVLCIIGALSAGLAMLQTQGPAKGPLYLYAVTNNGAAVGLFANRNHQAIFLASLLPIGIALISSQTGKLPQGLLRARRTRFPIASKLTSSAWQRGLLIFGSIAILLPMVIITGSRAGLLALAIGLLSAPLIVGTNTQQGRQAPARQNSIVTGLFILLLVLLLVSLATWLDRDEAIDRLMSSTPTDEMRMMILPVMREMILDYWPWGSGIGTFQPVYQIYEPARLLGPTYMNHAHNDWLEVAMTGGAPAVALLLAAIVAWLIAGARILSAGNRDSFQPFRRAALVVLLMLALASLTDYPLRTPSLGVLFTLCAVWLGLPFASPATAPVSPSERSSPEKHGN